MAATTGHWIPLSSPDGRRCRSDMAPDRPAIRPSRAPRIPDTRVINAWVVDDGVDVRVADLDEGDRRPDGDDGEPDNERERQHENFDNTSIPHVTRTGSAARSPPR